MDELPDVQGSGAVEGKFELHLHCPAVGTGPLTCALRNARGRAVQVRG